MNRTTTFRSKGHHFKVEESFCGTTPNNNVWILDKERNHWDWKLLTNYDYDQLVRRLKRVGTTYFNED